MTRYLLIVPALALLGAAPAPNLSPQAKPARVISPVPSTCAKIGSYTESRPDRPQMKRLGELPGAEAYMAVYRTDENGCLDPMLASERQGIRRP